MGLGLIGARTRFLVGVVLLIALVGGGLLFAIQGRGVSPAYALIDEPTLTVLRGKVDVQRPGAAFVQVSGDSVVRVGDRIRTSADSYAVVTYFDGSTTEIEPDAEIEIRRLERTPAGGQAVSFQQEIGQTWNRVERLADPASRFEVTTASAVAFVRGTDFRVIVEASGRTTVQVFSEAVIVQAAGVTVVVEAGFQTTIEPGQPPSPPVPIGAPRFAVRVEVAGPAFLWITDSLERSAGVHPEGNTLGNQLPGATISLGSQTMTIRDPAERYEMVLTGQGDGPVTVTVSALVGGQPIGSRAAGLASVLAAEASGAITRGGRLSTGFTHEQGNVRLRPLAGGGSPGGKHRVPRGAAGVQVPAATSLPEPARVGAAVATDVPVEPVAQPAPEPTEVPPAEPVVDPPPETEAEAVPPIEPIVESAPVPEAGAVPPAEPVVEPAPVPEPVAVSPAEPVVEPAPGQADAPPIEPAIEPAPGLPEATPVEPVVEPPPQVAVAPPVEPAAPPQPPAPALPPTTLEAEMLALINGARVSHGLPPLAVCDPLPQLAREHTRDMLQHGYFSHDNLRGEDPAARLAQAGIRPAFWGENISIDSSVRAAHEKDMGEVPPEDYHRQNILDPRFTCIGIGVEPAPDGRVLITVLFIP